MRTLRNPTRAGARYLSLIKKQSVMRTRKYCEEAIAQNNGTGVCVRVGSILKRRVKAAALTFCIWATLLLWSFF